MLICKNLAHTAIAISVFFTTAFAADTAPQLIDGPTYTQPQQMVEVEPGRRLNLHCVGTGSSTVVFESGLGVPLSNWRFVQPVVAHKTRTCAYERAGLGFSDAPTRASDSKKIADDLHRLLGAGSMQTPIRLKSWAWCWWTRRSKTRQKPTAPWTPKSATLRNGVPKS